MNTSDLAKLHALLLTVQSTLESSDILTRNIHSAVPINEDRDNRQMRSVAWGLFNRVNELSKLTDRSLQLATQLGELFTKQEQKQADKELGGGDEG